MYKICYSRSTVIKNRSRILDNVIVEEEKLEEVIDRLETNQGITVHGWIEDKDGDMRYWSYERPYATDNTH